MSKTTDLRTETAGKRKMPWYYYIIGLLAFSTLSVLIEQAFSVQLGWLPRGILLYACLYGLPKAVWESRQRP